MEGAVHHNSSESDTISDTILSPAQAQVIAALAQGRTITDAAHDAGQHRTTIRHWMALARAHRIAARTGSHRMSEALQAKASGSPPIARNAPCPCGSGNQYKRCCGSQ
jgi:uncharacterized protein YecA (UPF0149 family)